MRAVLAAAAAVAAAMAETSVAAFEDEVVLLQVKAADTPRGEEHFELICDEIKGCHYNFHTPPPYLACDEKRGCHYVGLEPAKKRVPGLLELPDPAELASTGELKTAELWANFVDKASRASIHWADEYRGALSGRFLPINWTRGEFVGAMADRKLSHIIHYLRTHKMATPSVDSSVPFVHFIGFHTSQCVDGPIGDVTETLGLLNNSPLASGYEGSEVAEGSCLDAGYSQGPSLLYCFSDVDLYHSSEHPGGVQEFFKALAAYGMKHGDSIPKMMDLCSKGQQP